MIKLVFFGSFQTYSVQTLQKLLACPDLKIVGVVTTPPRPGDNLVLTKTAVHQFALDHQLPVFPLENLDIIPSDLDKPDFIIVSGFGKLLNDKWLNFPKVMAINIHHSLLPKYPGRFPAEWAILRSESITGVTAIKMSVKFDQGEIIGQQSIPIASTDTRETLYHRLYDLAGDMACRLVTQEKFSFTSRPPTDFYARQITKDDGFVPYEYFLNQKSPNIPKIFESIPDKSDILNKMLRALTPWPGVWTTLPNGKRMKILSFNTEPVVVQIEGKNPTLWSEIAKYYTK